MQRSDNFSQQEEPHELKVSLPDEGLSENSAKKKLDPPGDQRTSGPASHVLINTNEKKDEDEEMKEELEFAEPDEFSAQESYTFGQMAQHSPLKQEEDMIVDERHGHSSNVKGIIPQGQVQTRSQKRRIKVIHESDGGNGGNGDDIGIGNDNDNASDSEHDIKNQILDANDGVEAEAEAQEGPSSNKNILQKAEMILLPKYFQSNLYNIIANDHNINKNSDLIVPSDFDFKVSMTMAINIASVTATHDSLLPDEKLKVEELLETLRAIRAEAYKKPNKDLSTETLVSAFRVTESLYRACNSFNMYKLQTDRAPYLTQDYASIKNGLTDFYRGFVCHKARSPGDRFISRMAAYVMSFFSKLYKEDPDINKEVNFSKFVKIVNDEVKDRWVNNIVKQFVANSVICMSCNTLQVGTYGYGSHYKRHGQAKEDLDPTYTDQLHKKFKLNPLRWSHRYQHQFYCVICDDFCDRDQVAMWKHLLSHDDRDLQKMGFLYYINITRHQNCVIKTLKGEAIRLPNKEKIFQAAGLQQSSQPNRQEEQIDSRPVSTVSDIQGLEHNHPPYLCENVTMTQQRQGKKSSRSPVNISSVVQYPREFNDIPEEEWIQNPFYKAFLHPDDGRYKKDVSQDYGLSVCGDAHDRFFCFVHEIKSCLEERSQSRHLILTEVCGIDMNFALKGHQEEIIFAYNTVMNMHEAEKQFPNLEYVVFLFEISSKPVIIRMNIKNYQFAIYDTIRTSLARYRAIMDFLTELVQEMNVQEEATYHHMAIPKAEDNAADDVTYCTAVYNLLCMTGFRNRDVRRELAIESVSWRWFLAVYNHRSEIVNTIKRLMAHSFTKAADVLESVYGNKDSSTGAFHSLFISCQEKKATYTFNPFQKFAEHFYSSWMRGNAKVFTHRSDHEIWLDEESVQQLDSLSNQAVNAGPHSTVTEVSEEEDTLKPKPRPRDSRPISQFEIEQSTPKDSKDNPPERLSFARGQESDPKIENPSEDKKFIVSIQINQLGKAILKKFEGFSAKLSVLKGTMNGKEVTIRCVPSPRDFLCILETIANSAKESAFGQQPSIELFSNPHEALQFLSRQKTLMQKRLFLMHQIIDTDPEAQSLHNQLFYRSLKTGQKHIFFVRLNLGRTEAQNRLSHEVMKERGYLLSFIYFDVGKRRALSCAFHDSKEQDKDLIGHVIQLTGHCNWQYRRHNFDGNPFGQNRGRESWADANAYIMWLLLLTLTYRQIPEITTQELTESLGNIKRAFTFISVDNTQIPMDEVIDSCCLTENSIRGTYVDALDMP